MVSDSMVSDSTVSDSMVSDSMVSDSKVSDSKVSDSLIVKRFYRKRFIDVILKQLYGPHPLLVLLYIHGRKRFYGTVFVVIKAPEKK